MRKVDALLTIEILEDRVDIGGDLLASESADQGHGLARLKQIRAEGFALSRGELDADVLGIAAPIRGHDDTVRAAVSIAALSSRVTAEQARKATTAVLAAAAKISERIVELEL